MRTARPSRSAEITCLMRAAEQLRDPAERLLDDPYARLFLGRSFGALLAAARATGWPPADPVGMTGYVVARHRFIDDCLERALAASEPVEQVVLLGAGYDTRPYRLGRSGGARPLFFELDHPTTGRRKARIVARAGPALPPRARRVVAIDFGSQSLTERLLAAGFAPERATFFIWEGVTMYLPEPAVRATLAELRGLARGRCELAVELWRGAASREPWVALANRAGTLALRLLFGEPVLFGLVAAGARRFFAEQGFELLEVADADLLRARYARGGRWIWPGNYVAHLRAR